MAEPAASQGEFSLQLAQWLIDQFNSDEALGTVSNQLDTLISQAQPGTNLSGQIGRLIFRKATQNSTDGLTQLYLRLCQYLFLNDLEHGSSPSDGSILEHVFKHCISSLETTNSPQNDRLGAIPVQRISVLVSGLYNSGLISIAQVYAYLRCLTASKAPVKDRLVGICTILEAHSWTLRIEPWRAEMMYVFQWSKDAVKKSPVDEDVKARVEAIARTEFEVQRDAKGSASPSNTQDNPGVSVKPSGSVHAQSVVNDEDSNRNNFGHSTIAPDERPQQSKSAWSFGPAVAGNQTTSNVLARTETPGQRKKRLAKERKQEAKEREEAERKAKERE